jgi:hypothetical protein
LPLQSRIESTGNGWLLRLALRAEHVTVEKRTVIAEEVAVRLHPVQDSVRVEDTVRREELHVDYDRPPEYRRPPELTVRAPATPPIDNTQPVDVRPMQGRSSAERRPRPRRPNP